VIMGETDRDAQRKVDLYNEGVDVEAVAFMKGQASLDKKSTGTPVKVSPTGTGTGTGTGTH